MRRLRLIDLAVSAVSMLATLAIVAAVLWLLLRPVRERFEVASFREPGPDEIRAVVDASGYFEGFSAADCRARRCAAPADCRAAFLRSVEPLTGAERALLGRLVGRASASDPRLAGGATPGWAIVKFLGSGGEGPYPHTRGHIVFLPRSFFGSAPDQQLRTLVHERVHVLQRASIPGFTPKGVRVRLADVGVQGHVRSNPDLDGYVYEHAPGRACVQLFDSGTPASLAESRPVEISLRDGLPTGSPCEYEHPNERMAYEYS
jgi:hypothetical protein